MSNHRQRGLTLIEIMVAVVILMILAYALYMIVFNATVTYTNQTRLGDIHNRARTTLDEMAKELRQADITNLQITPNATYGGHSIRFRPVTGYNYAAGQYTWGNAVEYVYEPSRVDANNNGIMDEGRIVRIENGTVRKTLTDYVKTGGMVITKTGDSVSIEVTFIIADYKNKVLESTLTTAATLRNETKVSVP